MTDETLTDTDAIDAWIATVLTMIAAEPERVPSWTDADDYGDASVDLPDAPVPDPWHRADALAVAIAVAQVDEAKLYGENAPVARYVDSRHPVEHAVTWMPGYTAVVTDADDGDGFAALVFTDYATRWPVPVADVGTFADVDAALAAAEDAAARLALRGAATGTLPRNAIPM